MRHSGPAVILFALASACTESATEPAAPIAPVLQETSTARILEPGQYPDGVPPELQVPSIIHSLIVDAGWSPDGFAYGGATLEFTATSGYVESRVVTDLGTSRTEKKQASALLPLRRSLQTPVPTVPMATCTGVIRGEGLGKVWNQFVGGTSTVTWAEQIETGSKRFDCPRTRTTTTTTPVGESNDSRNTCYLVEIDHYWYYPGTGEIEYRYTEAYRYCKNGEAYM